MAEQLPDADLQRASENLKRLHGYFAARSSWETADEAAAEILSAIRGTVDDTVKAIVAIMEKLGIMVPSAVRFSEAPQQPDGELDSATLGKFQTFLGQLKVWFQSRSEAAVSPTGAKLLRDVHESLIGTTIALAIIIDGEAPDLESSADQRAAAIPPKRAKLELLETDQTPMLVDFQGKKQLTGEAQDLLATFIKENELEMPEYKRTKLEENVVRWLESAPEGMMLVIKIGGLHGRYEPFPSYTPKPREEVPGD
jgi:hypothetical protein